MVFNRPKKKRKKDANDVLAQKEPQNGRSRIWIAILCVLLFFSLLFNVLQHEQKSQLQPAQIENNVGLGEPREPVDASSEISGHWYGLCPKNSIKSIEDFKRIVDNDPLLSHHFADFQWENARTGRHENTIYTHVTYRKNEKIGVTKRVIKLPAGDRFITDGKRWVRMFCGNDYVQAGDRFTERSDTDLNRLIDRAENSSKAKKTSKEDFPEAVPEAGTFLLFTAGLVGLALLNFLPQRKIKSAWERVRNKRSKQ